jgi:hypothetical protein
MRLRELPPYTSTQLSLTSFMMGQTTRGYHPSFGIKSGWSPRSKIMGTSDHLRYSRVAGLTAMTSRAVSFCFLVGSYESGPRNVVDLFMSLGEDTPGILGLLLLISWLGRLQNLICNTLVSVVVSGLVLSLGLKNANAIQEAFEFARPEPVLLMMMRSFYHFDRTVQFSLLVMALR